MECSWWREIENENENESSIKHTYYITCADYFRTQHIPWNVYRLLFFYKCAHNYPHWPRYNLLQIVEGASASGIGVANENEQKIKSNLSKSKNK
jgi:hypothetical protein